MGIESNEEAYKTMRNSIGSMENRMREIYNKGYKDGIKEGINRAMQKIADSILEEVEADRKTEPTISKMEQVDKDINVRSKTEPNNCDTCRHKGVEGCEQPCLGCGRCGLYEPKDEPQTGCAWR